MVRVHQPPGGEAHLNDDVPKKPYNIRVLKPPGGGSSISFGDDDDFASSKTTKSAPLNAAPKNDNQQEQQQPAKTAETNGTSSPPQTPTENNLTATKESNCNSTANTTNGVAVTNGTITNGTSTSGCSTPNSSRLDTQNRLFGEQPQKGSPFSPRIRDHQRSNIFSEVADKAFAAKSVYRRPWTRRDPVTGVGVLCWDLHAPRFAPSKRKANACGNETPEPKTPEVKTPDQLQSQNTPQQRQRVPPGGFSTKLW